MKVTTTVPNPVPITWHLDLTDDEMALLLFGLRLAPYGEALDFLYDEFCDRVGPSMPRLTERARAIHDTEVT